MPEVKKFSDFGIKVAAPPFSGDKIKMSKLLNKEITVLDYKVKPSTKNEGDCLHLQLSLDGTTYVNFNGSKYLIEMISQVPKTDFPFKTTIIEENDRYQFS